MLLSTVHDPPTRNVNLINLNTADLNKKKKRKKTYSPLLLTSTVPQYENTENKSLDEKSIFRECGMQVLLSES